MLQTGTDSDTNSEKVNYNHESNEIKQNTDNTESDPLLISLRNNQKLNSIIEEVRHLLEEDNK